jgi:hypothetical protein
MQVSKQPFSLLHTGALTMSPLLQALPTSLPTSTYIPLPLYIYFFGSRGCASPVDGTLSQTPLTSPYFPTSPPLYSVPQSCIELNKSF